MLRNATKTRCSSLVYPFERKVSIKALWNKKISFCILDSATPRAFAPLYSRNVAIVRRQVIFPAEITTRVRVKLSRPKVLKTLGRKEEWRKVWHMENGNCKERHDGFLYLLPRLSTEPKPTPAAHSNLAPASIGKRMQRYLEIFKRCSRPELIRTVELASPKHFRHLPADNIKCVFPLLSTNAKA